METRSSSFSCLFSLLSLSYFLSFLVRVRVLVIHTWPMFLPTFWDFLPIFISSSFHSAFREDPPRLFRLISFPSYSPSNQFFRLSLSLPVRDFSENYSNRRKTKEENVSRFLTGGRMMYINFPLLLRERVSRRVLLELCNVRT